MSDLGPPLTIGQQLTTLSSRATRLFKVGKINLIGGGVFGVLALAFGLAGILLAPNLTISSVTLPDGLLLQFSDVAQAVNVTTNVGSFEAPVAELVSWLTGSFGTVIGLGALAVGLGMGLVRHTIMPVITGISVALAVNLGPNVLQSLSAASGSPMFAISSATSVHTEYRDSPRDAFRSLVSDKKWDEALRGIADLKDHGGAAGQYVTAQIDILRGKVKDAESPLHAVESSEKALDASGAATKSLYAMDMTVFRKPQSVRAKWYGKQGNDLVALCKRVSSFFADAAEVLIVGFLFFGGFGRNIGKRVQRVRELALTHNVDLGEDLLPGLLPVEQPLTESGEIYTSDVSVRV